MNFLSERFKDNRFSLQTLCLGVVVKNFKQFHLAFTTTKDARMQRNMEFLQRRFSDYLAEELEYNDIVLYFDFVINKHLTSVDFCWYYIGHLKSLVKSIDDFLRRLPNLTRVKFYTSGDKILKSIAKFCPKIVEIDANYSRISDKGIKYLCESKNGMLPCPELKRILRLGRPFSITDKGAQWLIRNVPSIEQLDYPNLPLVLHSICTDISSQHQKVLIYNLTKIQFQECDEVQHISDVLKTCLTVCPNLEELFCKISEKEQFDTLRNSHLRLKKLNLWFSAGSLNINIDNYLKASGGRLTSLSISNCATSLFALEEHCPALQELSAFYIDFTDDDDDRQPIFPFLTDFGFGAEKPGAVKTVGLLPLLSPKVEHVRIACPVLSDEMKNKILMWSRNPAAKTIAFVETGLEIGFLRECLLNSLSLVGMLFCHCIYDVDNPEEILEVLAEDHPNKPEIIKL